MKYFPINIDINNKKALVVGGGQIAARKVERLKQCGARITVVSPEFCRDLSRAKGVKRIKRRYRKSDIQGARIVISATDSEAANRRVYEHASAANIPVNVVDQPHLCTFTVPAVIERGDLLITISTGGGSPALSSKIRKQLEKQLDPSFQKHLKLLSEIRPSIRASSLNEQQRGALLKKMASDEVASTLNSHGVRAARQLMKAMLLDAKK